MSTKLSISKQPRSRHYPTSLSTICTLAYGLLAAWRVGSASPTFRFDLLDRMDGDTYRAAFHFVPRPVLAACMRLNRRTHERLYRDLSLRNRVSAYGVLVSIDNENRWLRSDDDAGWNQIKDFTQSLIEVNPGALPGSPPVLASQTPRTLIDRLPLAIWREEAIGAAADVREPYYLRTFSHILSLRLPSMIFLTEMNLTNEARKRGAAQLLLAMYGYLSVAGDAIWSAAQDLSTAGAGSYCWAVARGAAGDAAQGAAGKAARDSAEYAAINVYYDTVRNSAWEAAKAALTQLRQASPPDQPLSAELIGRTAYRAAELAALVMMLEGSTLVVGGVLTATVSELPRTEELAMFATQAAWKAFNRQHCVLIGDDEEKIHFLRPWLKVIDQLVVEIAACSVDSG